MTTHLERSFMFDVRRTLDGIGAPSLHSGTVDVFASMLFITRRVSLHTTDILDLIVPQRHVNGSWKVE